MAWPWLHERPLGLLKHLLFLSHLASSEQLPHTSITTTTTIIVVPRTEHDFFLVPRYTIQHSGLTFDTKKMSGWADERRCEG